MDNEVLGVLDAHGWQSYVGDGQGIWVSAAQQRLYLIDNHRLLQCYVCSTGKAGLGNQANSGRTPLGWHRVGEKIGDGLPAGAIFKERQWDGQIWRHGMQIQDDLILSRILWLEGLEDGVNRGGNVDTWNRYIYIHGTNRIEDLGEPASAGCVRLDPKQMIDLFNRVEPGCYVLITRE